jgi:hypothetical protein
MKHPLQNLDAVEARDAEPARERVRASVELRVAPWPGLSLLMRGEHISAALPRSGVRWARRPSWRACTQVPVRSMRARCPCRSRPAASCATATPTPVDQFEIPFASRRPSSLAVASYADSMNIREYLCVVRPTLVAGHASQTHEIQRPKIYERFGSATRLKAGSHPIGGRESVVTTGDGTVGIFFGAGGNRSPLWVEAAPAPCTAAAKPVTARQLTTDYSNVPSGPTPHTLRKNSSAISYPSPTPLGRETRMASTCRPIARWQMHANG